MRRATPVLAGMLLIVAGTAHAAWQDVALRDSPRSAVATCLRATAAPGVVGLLGPVGRHQSPYDLLNVGPSGVARNATVRLGPLFDCPAVAVDPSGHGVVAGVAGGERGARVLAALSAPGAGFGRALTLGRATEHTEPLAAAVSPRGDAVVAWITRREPRRRPSTSRVYAALRPAGGSFGEATPLTPWRKGGNAYFGGRNSLTAAMDANGTATVAWSQGIPDRGNISELLRVEVATAPSRSGFGPAQVLSRAVQDVTTLALAVAPDGAALIGHDGQETIWLFERLTGVARFDRLDPVRSQRADWQAPAVALAADGSAVVAWRTDDPSYQRNPGVAMIERTPGGVYSAPRIAWRGAEPQSVGAWAVILTTREGAVVPEDAGNTALRVALGPDGRYLLAWGVERVTALGDGPTGVRLATGLIGAPPSSARTLGCRCRDVNGLALLQLVDGSPGLAFTDNVTRVFGPDGEFAWRAGRLRIVAQRPAVRLPAPPSVRLAAPPATTLRYDQGLLTGARCGGPCDLRAYVIDARNRSRGVGTASLRRAGRVRVRIVPRIATHLAPPRGGRARLLVRAWTPGGTRYSEDSTGIELRRAPLRPLARLLSVQAVRRGDAIVVTWMTDRPVRSGYFEVEGRDRRREPIGEPAVPEGDGKTSFRVRLRLGAEADEAKSVAVRIHRGEAPADHRTVVVPVEG